MQELCPDDIQAFPITIKNLKPDGPAFENHDFFYVNVTHTIEILDMERTTFTTLADDPWPEKRVFKEEDCWNGHLIAKDHITPTILFHPRLAKEFCRSKSMKFLTDEEWPSV